MYYFNNHIWYKYTGITKDLYSPTIQIQIQMCLFPIKDPLKVRSLHWLRIYNYMDIMYTHNFFYFLFFYNVTIKKNKKNITIILDDTYII